MVQFAKQVFAFAFLATMAVFTFGLGTYLFQITSN